MYTGDRRGGGKAMIQTRPRLSSKGKNRVMMADSYLLPQCPPNALPAISITPPVSQQMGTKSLQCARTKLEAGNAGINQKGLPQVQASRQKCGELGSAGGHYCQALCEGLYAILSPHKDSQGE